METIPWITRPLVKARGIKLIKPLFDLNQLLRHFLPRFPEYVCEDEPCGECLDSDKFPCGDYCIPSDEFCLLSGLCSSSTFQCGDKCVPFTKVCDGRFDCADATDEENCKERNGSWMCQGTIQPRSQPCL